ncbi:hypothetical protein K488DRAFT_90832 [Vararia minispora EC-137]|uniref:Uncharacterized protein n=1 Tax=Vararia minispora EC-137 TaxID=1314806 RepID=A0ACB8Q6S3_9AGAM|nr:hypothetical protein K488DRAFT_90832 [Vararia minispora EC-137]
MEPPADPAYGLRCIADALHPNGCECICVHKVAWNWMDILCVCKTWYRTAYNNPRFWQRLPHQNPALFSSALTLSLRLPLSLISIHPTHWRLPKDDLDRLREIIIDFSSTSQLFPYRYRGIYSWGILEALRTFSPRSLERLQISTNGINEIYLDFLLFNGTAPPRLREVRLHSVVLTSSFPALCGTLTSLKISHVDLEGWPSQILHAVLSRMPLLEYLDLLETQLPGDLRDRINEQTPTHPPPCPLHAMCSLSVQGAYFQVTRFLLQIVDIPPTTSLTLVYDHFDDGGFDLGEHTAFILDKHFGAAREKGSFYYGLQVECALQKYTFALETFEMMFSSPCSTHLGASLPDFCTIRHLFCHQDTPLLPYFEAVCNSVPIIGIASGAPLRVRTEGDYFSAQHRPFPRAFACENRWWGFLETIGAIDTLEVADHATAAIFLPVLQDRTRFPNITSFRLQDVDLTRLCRGSVMSLGDCLFEHVREKHALRGRGAVRLVGGIVDARTIERLREVLGEENVLTIGVERYIRRQVPLDCRHLGWPCPKEIILDVPQDACDLRPL